MGLRGRCPGDYNLQHREAWSDYAVLQLNLCGNEGWGSSFRRLRITLAGDTDPHRLGFSKVTYFKRRRSPLSLG